MRGRVASVIIHNNKQQGSNQHLLSTLCLSVSLSPLIHCVQRTSGARDFVCTTLLPSWPLHYHRRSDRVISSIMISMTCFVTVGSYIYNYVPISQVGLEPNLCPGEMAVSTFPAIEQFELHDTQYSHIKIIVKLGLVKFLIAISFNFVVSWVVLIKLLIFIH